MCWQAALVAITFDVCGVCKSSFRFVVLKCCKYVTACLDSVERAWLDRSPFGSGYMQAGSCLA